MPPLRGWFSLQLIDGLRLFGKLRASCGLHSSAASRLGVGIVASSYRSAGRAAPPKICADSRTEVVAFAVVALAEQQVSPLAVADAPDFGRNDKGLGDSGITALKRRSSRVVQTTVVQTFVRLFGARPSRAIR